MHNEMNKKTKEIHVNNQDIPQNLTDEELQKQINDREAELKKRLQAKKDIEEEERLKIEKKNTEERRQIELLEVIRLEKEKLEKERRKLVDERLKFQTILREMKSSERSSESPRSILLQKTFEDEENGHFVNRNSRRGSPKEAQLLLERAKLEKERREFEEIKSLFLNQTDM